MAEQQPQNKAIVEETKVPPAEEAEEEAVPKAGSPVPPVAKASTPELTESPEMVAAMTVQLEVLTHKDFIVCTLRVYAIGYLQKSIGEVLVRTKPTEYRWRGGIQHKESHE